jgi:hypothetical protein
MLTPDERRALEAYFTFCDANQDGYITVAELQDALSLHLNENVANEGDAVDLLSGEKDVESFFKAVDYDKDRRLTLGEIIRFHEEQRDGKPAPVGSPPDPVVSPANTNGTPPQHIIRGRRFVRRKPGDPPRR